MFFLRVASAPLASVASDPSTRTAPGEAAPGRVMARAGMPGLRFSSHGNEICAISLPRQQIEGFRFRGVRGCLADIDLSEGAHRARGGRHLCRDPADLCRTRLFHRGAAGWVADL